MPAREILNLPARTSAASATRYPPADARTETVTYATRASLPQLVRGGAHIDNYLHLLSEATKLLSELRWTVTEYWCLHRYTGQSVADPRLVALLSLKHNWDGYGAEAPNHLAFYNADAVLGSLLGYPIGPD